METYVASEIMRWSEEKVWALDKGNNQRVKMRFSDGTVEAPVRRFIYDWYFWEFHRQIKDLPLSKRHHIDDRPMDKATDNEVINRILRDIYYLTGEKNYPKTKAAKVASKVVNSLYRITDTHIEEYFTTTDITDVISLMHNEEIREIVLNTKPDRLSINTMYDKIRWMINESQTESISKNPIVVAARMGVIPVNQILQLITIRGFITEINSCLFVEPALFNYASGNYNPTDFLKDSRSGTKALASTKTPLEQSEYQGRRLRLLGMYVKRILAGDCGSRHYLDYPVCEKSLKHIDGVWYLGEDGKEHVAWADSKELIGKVVKIRNPLTCLHHENVCERCYGLLHLSVPDDTNIGWSCAAQFSEGISQGTLSLKHLDFNAIAKLLVRYLTGKEDDPSYLYTDPNNDTVWKVRPNKLNRLVIILPRDDRATIAYDALQNMDIDEVKDLREVIQFRFVQFQELSGTGFDETVTEEVGVSSNKATITKTFLRYMRWRGFEVLEKGEIMVKLDKWNPDYPLLAQEFKAENNLDITRLLAWVYEGRGKGGTAMNHEADAEAEGFADNKLAVKHTKNPSDALYTLYSKISYKIPLHVSVMGVMLKAMRCHSTNKKVGVDYSMANGDADFCIGDLKSTLKNRSMGCVLAFEDLKEIISTPDTFDREYADDHPFDVFLTGKQ